jgi:hypothetical protein
MYRSIYYYKYKIYKYLTIANCINEAGFLSDYAKVTTGVYVVFG